MIDFTKLKSCLDKIVDDYNTPGVDCIVYKEHEMVFRYFTGLSDIESNKKISGNELYFIFSMTKMITCTAALQLFEKGKYLMNDPISKYLPEFEKMKVTLDEHDSKDDQKIMNGSAFGDDKEVSQNGYAKNQIKVIDLLTMTAGMDYALNDAAITKALNKGKKSTQEIVKAMAQKTLLFEPGTDFKYSLCHDILGALIEIWSGQKLGEYMKANIFDPLGMKNTFFSIPKTEKQRNRMAALYTCDNDRKPKKLPLECAYNITNEYESGGAGLISCTEDYALFLDALSCKGIGKSGNKILSPASVELMKTNHLKGKQQDTFSSLRPGYGYGFGVRTHIDKSKSGSLSPIGEFGWDGAAGAFSLVDTDNKLSLTYFQHFHNWDVKMQTEMRNALYNCIN